jgi:thiol:disulfide interchange protein
MFGAIALGLAGPYAATTLVPTWGRLIPRPGPWMVQVRRGLGFSLVATSVWLLWVMGRTVGVDAQAMVLAYLVTVAFAVWVFGALQDSARRPVVVGAGLLCAFVVAFGLVSLPLEPMGIAPRMRPVAGNADPDSFEVSWQPYDPAAIRGELSRGRPVFVDFTADWCITCKVNERVVLDNPRVVSEFERLGVATFKADWTLYDEEIRSILASYGKAGVPMYLVYGPGAPADPAVLPELLTIDIVVDALQDAVGGSEAAMNPTREPRPAPAAYPRAPATSPEEERS